MSIVMPYKIYRFENILLLFWKNSSRNGLMGFFEPSKREKLKILSGNGQDEREFNVQREAMHLQINYRKKEINLRVLIHLWTENFEILSQVNPKSDLF